MNPRVLHPDQPESFAFSAASLKRVEAEIAKYPAGRQASAVIAALTIGQEQEGWVTRPMIEAVADMLSMPKIRVLEVATFYTMFHLAPAGKHVVAVCSCVPCSLIGSGGLVAVCKKHIAEHPGEVSADGQLSWEEAECLGACAEAPAMQVDGELYGHLTDARAVAIIEAFRRGEHPAPEPKPESKKKAV